MGVSPGQRRYAERLAGQGRLAALGKLSAGIAYDLNNPAAASRSAARLRRTGPQGDDRLVVTIADDGPGVPPELADRIFARFLTTKAVGKSTGLDLTRCLVRDHGGRLTLEHAPGGGTCFTVDLLLEGAPERREVG